MVQSEASRQSHHLAVVCEAGQQVQDTLGPGVVAMDLAVILETLQDRYTHTHTHTHTSNLRLLSVHICVFRPSGRHTVLLQQTGWWQHFCSQRRRQGNFFLMRRLCYKMLIVR